jgi:Protein of unknown function (DUF1097)
VKQCDAYTISIGTLAAIDTYITAKVLPLPVWVTFIAWASFFILGGKRSGWLRSVASNLSGIAIASLSLLAISAVKGDVVIAALCVGLGSAAMVQASKMPLLTAIPAIVWGFASTVGTSIATARPITELSLHNPALVAAAAMILGASFGYASEAWGDAICRRRPAVLAAAQQSEPA